MRHLFFGLALAGLSACAPEPDIWFTEDAAARGLDFVHQSGQDPSGIELLFPDIMGSGAALADVDNDGDLDAYIIQSGRLPVARSSDFDPPGNRLFINDGNGHFVPAPNPGAAADNGYGMGVAAGDYDNDGDVDFYVTNVGRNVLLNNDGSGQFTNVAEAAGVAHDGFGTAAAFIDLDRDGDLDLFLVNYIDWDPANEQACYFGDSPTYCPPTNYPAPAMDALYRNNGDGTFTDVTSESGIDLAYGRHAGNYRASRPGLGVVGSDFNQDGLVDIFVANDLMVDQLWINKGGLEFEDRASFWGCDADDHGIAKAGMGVAAADIDNDADTDLVVVNNIRQTDSFFRNEGDHFTDVTAALGLGASSRRNTRFGVTLTDFDNDGWLDLYHANGAVAMFQETDGDPYRQPNVLFQNDGAGKFVEIAPAGGVTRELVHTSRGMAVGDVDNDGGMDLLIVNRDAPAYLLMNARSRGNWIRFRAIDSNGRDAHNARLTIGAQTREVQTAGSYLASNDPRVHVGLGTATSIDTVQVRWPTGELEQFGPFTAGDTHMLRQGTGSK